MESTQVPYAYDYSATWTRAMAYWTVFMHLFLMCLCPTTTETEEAHTWCQNWRHKSKADIFLEMHNAHDTLASSHYMFSWAAQQQPTAHKDDFIQELNDAIREGNVPAKSKKVDLLQRVSSALFMCLISSPKNWLWVENQDLHPQRYP